MSRRCLKKEINIYTYTLTQGVISSQINHYHSVPLPFYPLTNENMLVFPSQHKTRRELLLPLKLWVVDNLLLDHVGIPYVLVLIIWNIVFNGF